MKKPEYYVSLDGRDSWSGSLAKPNRTGTDGPFATLERARRALREARKQDGLRNGAVVWLRGGVYHCKKPFRLDKQDSGMPGAPIEYRAYRREPVRLSGGVPVTGFCSWKGAILVADVSALGLTGDGATGMELFFRGRRMDLARWPNHDPADRFNGNWALINSVPKGTKRWTTFRYKGDRPKRWAHPERAQVHVFPKPDWKDFFFGIAKLDIKRREITVPEKSPYEFRPGRRFYVRNVLEELDQPGEWYLDPVEHKLYFWPLDPALKEGDVELSRLDVLVETRNAWHVTLRGLTLENCRADAAQVRGGTDVRFAGCVVRNTGGYGINFNDTTASGADGCDVYETGRGGIILRGGDRRTLTPGRNYARNCHVHHYARQLKCYQAGVAVAGVGNVIAHCEIHHAPHNGILLGGNEHIVEYNDIHHVAMEGSDSGAFYMGRDWSMQGNVLRYNLWHDIYGYGCQRVHESTTSVTYESPHAAWAVYLDDCASGTTVYGNIFYRVPMCAVVIGGGRDNVVENNIMIGSCPSVHIDARWDAYPHYGGIQQERLEAVNYKQPPYSTRYPNLLKVYDENPRFPMGNRIVRNIVAYADDDFFGFWEVIRRRGAAAVWELSNFHPESTQIDHNLIWHAGRPVRIDRNELKHPREVIPWRQWKREGFDAHSVLADPGFVNATRDDYRLKRSSPAWKLGFKPIPVDKIGCVKNAARASWPLARELEPVEHVPVKKRYRLT